MGRALPPPFRLSQPFSLFFFFFFSPSNLSHQSLSEWEPNADHPTGGVTLSKQMSLMETLSPLMQLCVFETLMRTREDKGAHSPGGADFKVHTHSPRLSSFGAYRVTPTPPPTSPHPMLTAGGLEFSSLSCNIPFTFADLKHTPARKQRALVTFRQHIEPRLANYMAHKPNQAHPLCLQIKFYWHTVLSIQRSYNNRLHLGGRASDQPGNNAEAMVMVSQPRQLEAGQMTTQAYAHGLWNMWGLQDTRLPFPPPCLTESQGSGWNAGHTFISRGCRVGHKCGAETGARFSVSTLGISCLGFPLLAPHPRSFPQPPNCGVLTEPSDMLAPTLSPRAFQQTSKMLPVPR